MKSAFLAGRKLPRRATSDISPVVFHGFSSAAVLCAGLCILAKRDEYVVHAVVHTVHTLLVGGRRKIARVADGCHVCAGPVSERDLQG